MAAQHNINPQQLQLFMTGTELKGMITGSIDRAPGQSMDQMWDRKLKESKGSTLRRGHGAGTYKSLQEDGWRDPGPEGGFEINHVVKYGGIPEWDRTETSVTGAHHRIAAAADIEAKTAGTKKPRTIYFPTASNQYEYPSIKPEGR